MKKMVQTPKTKAPTVEERLTALESEFAEQTKKFEELFRSMARALNEQRSEIISLRDTLAQECELRRSRQQNALKELKSE